MSHGSPPGAALSTCCQWIAYRFEIVEMRNGGSKIEVVAEPGALFSIEMTDIDAATAQVLRASRDLD